MWPSARAVTWKKKLTIFVATVDVVCLLGYFAHQVRHINRQRKFRPAKYLRRGKIAEAVSNGVSNYYYSMLKNTPVEEIMAGNVTRSLTKDVLKTFI